MPDDPPVYSTHPEGPCGRIFCLHPACLRWVREQNEPPARKDDR